MTNLKPEHHKAIEAVKSEKIRYDTQKAELDAKYARDLGIIKAPLVNAVKWADEIGTPARRIALDGLKTKDTNTVRRLILGITKAPSTAVVIPTDDEPLTEPAVHSPEENIYTVTDVDGVIYEFWGIDLDAVIVMERSTTQDNSVDADVPAPAKVIAALKREIPRADFSTLLDEEDSND